ncbi:MAG: hypothetical protein AAF830_02805 [Pseudomonadota bacterium]
MKTLLNAAAMVLLVTATTAGASFTDRDHNRIKTAWSQLSEQQQTVIELVAKDIWDTERENRGLPYHQVSERRKAEIRAEAMKRLGFNPSSVTGYDV